MPLDYYETLGVSRKATQKEINKAFRKLARKYHPDVNPGNKEAEQRFKEIAEAHAVLSDPERRERYDQFGHSAFEAGFDPGRTYTTSFGDVDLGEIFGRGGQGFGDIFGDLFTRGQRKTNAPERGEDLQYTIELSFEDAARGVTTTIALHRDVHCETCGGTGARPGSRRRYCPKCEGKGEISTGRGFFHLTQPCPECGGSGEVSAIPCHSCGGRGTRRRAERLQLKIPAGVDSGSKIRLQGKGGPGKHGGSPGDLYIVTKVHPHPYFERKGDNIYLDVPITIAEAALGARVRVPTIDGHATVAIPPGVRSGQMLRLKGKGVPHLKGGGRGDHYVVIQVAAPTNLNERARELLREAEKLAPYDPRAELHWG